MTRDNDRRLQASLDREELFDLVRRERFARDQRRFDVMAACFHRDAYVLTSWYDGHGGQAYVDVSRKWMAATGNSKHWVFPAFAQVDGDRATVESPAMIFNRATLHDAADAEGVEQHAGSGGQAGFARRLGGDEYARRDARDHGQRDRRHPPARQGWADEADLTAGWTTPGIWQEQRRLRPAWRRCFFSSPGSAWRETPRGHSQDRRRGCAARNGRVPGGCARSVPRRAPCARSEL